MEAKPLTEAEKAYVALLNQDVVVAEQAYKEAVRRLSVCIQFLRQQHEAGKGWELRDADVGFILADSVASVDMVDE